jgi:hypothetical protein
MFSWQGYFSYIRFYACLMESEIFCLPPSHFMASTLTIGRASGEHSSRACSGCCHLHQPPDFAGKNAPKNGGTRSPPAKKQAQDRQILCEM